MVIVNLICTSKNDLTAKTQNAIEEFIATFFEVGAEIKVKPFKASENVYLQQAYKQTFMQSNFVQSFGSWFNQNPADSFKAMYKVLLLSLQP